MEENIKPKPSWGQQERPKWEQNLSPIMRDDLDRHRAGIMKNVNEHPAIWEKLHVLEHKMDEILTLLRAR